MVKLSARAVLLSLCLGLAFFAGQPVAARGGGGGKKEDPRDTVKRVVTEAIKGNKGVGAALIRLVFHDCWVNGCDGSVLIDSIPYVNRAEKEAVNNIGLRGFGVINTIKSELAYPDKVSCADILVLAGREATFILSEGNIDYKVKMGRMDGRVSSADAADAALPHSTANFEELKANFKNRTFNTRELVALSGVHAIGVAHRSSFADRINDATITPISTKYMQALKEDVKSKPIQPNNIRDKEEAFRNKVEYDPTDVNTTMEARGTLDNSYYHANLQNMVLFRSDWELRNDTSGDAGNDLESFKADAKKWYLHFGKAMAKLSELTPAVGSALEIRKKCSEINKN